MVANASSLGAAPRYDKPARAAPARGRRRRPDRAGDEVRIRGEGRHPAEDGVERIRALRAHGGGGARGRQRASNGDRAFPGPHRAAPEAHGLRAVSQRSRRRTLRFEAVLETPHAGRALAPPRKPGAWLGCRPAPARAERQHVPAGAPGGPRVPHRVRRADLRRGREGGAHLRRCRSEWHQAPRSAPPGMSGGAGLDR